MTKAEITLVQIRRAINLSETSWHIVSRSGDVYVSTSKNRPRGWLVFLDGAGRVVFCEAVVAIEGARPTHDAKFEYPDVIDAASVVAELRRRLEG